jgi:hypothetical protein
MTECIDVMSSVMRGLCECEFHVQTVAQSNVEARGRERRERELNLDSE